MIQKATELGVSKLLPIIFDRTIVRKINKERLEKIVIEASEQSNRINVPSIEILQNLDRFLKKKHAAGAPGLVDASERCTSSPR